MKKLLCALVLVAIALVPLAAAAQTTQGKGAPPAKKAAAEKAYVCQACDYVGDKPGKCPKCGKELTAVNKADVYYACDMCHVTSDKPGKCPKCGMNMTLKVKGTEKPKDSKEKAPATKP